MSYALKAKRVFLSFAQSLFAADPWLKWQLDPKKTDIVIGDKYFVNNPIIEKRPAIILARNTLWWGFHTICQTLSENLITGDIKIADLIHGNLTYNVIAKNTQVAERLADYLYARIIGHKSQFVKNGINKIYGVQMGQETVVKGPTGILLTNVPIHISFAMQEVMSVTHNVNSISICASSTGNVNDATLGIESAAFGKGCLTEGRDFMVSGNEVRFINIPSGVELTISYIGDITSQEYNEQVDYTSGGSKIYLLQEPVNSLYYLYSGLLLYLQTMENRVSRIDE